MIQHSLFSSPRMQLSACQASVNHHLFSVCACHGPRPICRTWVPGTNHPVSLCSTEIHWNPWIISSISAPCSHLIDTADQIWNGVLASRHQSCPPFGQYRPIKVYHYQQGYAFIKCSSCQSETWTVVATDIRSLESFYIKCQKHILGIRWHDRIRNTEITERTGLPALMDQIIRRRNSLFGHVARLWNDTPAHQALRRQIDICLGRLPDRTWKRPPSRPRSKWLDQIRSDNNLPPADL